MESLGPEFDSLRYQLELLIMHLPSSEVDHDEEHVTKSKLAQATKIITMYEPEVQPPLLGAIDILAPSGQIVGRLTTDEIRFMNLAVNGGSPEREAYYRGLHRWANDELTSVLVEVLAEKYGFHDDLRDIAHAAVWKGAELATRDWERYYTTDAPEKVREENYRSGVLGGDLLLVYHMRRANLPISEEDINRYVKRVRGIVLDSLKKEDGVHKQ